MDPLVAHALHVILQCRIRAAYALQLHQHAQAVRKLDMYELEIDTWLEGAAGGKGVGLYWSPKESKPLR